MEAVDRTRLDTRVHRALASCAARSHRTGAWCASRT